MTSYFSPCLTLSEGGRSEQQTILHSNVIGKHITCSSKFQALAGYLFSGASYIKGKTGLRCLDVL